MLQQDNNIKCRWSHEELHVESHFFKFTLCKAITFFFSSKNKTYAHAQSVKPLYKDSHLPHDLVRELNLRSFTFWRHTEHTM